MKLPGLQNRSWASSALVVGLVALSNVGPVAAQQFTDLTLGHDGYPDLSERCYDALNTTVQGCPGFVAANAVDIARLVSGQLEALCTPSCRSSLSSVRSVIASGCSADTDVVEFNRIVYPATYTIDRILHAYDVSCARDADTGVFCDEVYLDNLANGTSADECSDCSLGVGRILLNSPFGFDEGFAADFKSRTASCGVAGYAFTSPAPYAVSTLPPAATETGAACEAPYEVQPGDSCDSIATARGVSTHAVIRAGNAGPGCTNLAAGKKLCLPEPCTQYRVEWDDSCADVLAAVPGLQAQHLLTWNPNINPLCTNLGDMVSHLLCVSPPGRSLGDVTAITEAPPATTQPVPTAVPRPANAKAESHERCAGWYEIQAGDYCQLLSVRHAIELRDFFFLNPAVNDPDCDNLWLETSYCVKYVGDINTYPSYPYSTTPPYTLTAPTYVTTTRPPLETVAPSETPIAIHPLAAGSHDEAEGCLDFVQHIEVPVLKDQFQQPDVPSLTEIVNTCDFIVASAGIEFEDFVEWNPSLEGLEPCKLQRGLRYCVDHEGTGEDDGTLPPASCIEVETPEPGTVSTCSCFTTVNGYNAETYLCSDLAESRNITVADLVSWNPWIGSEEDCDAGLYANLASAGERPVCTAVSDGPPPVTPPGPTQEGIVEGCRSYYVAAAGDGCWAIADTHGIALDDLYEWNPALNVGGECAGLWPDYAYCVLGPASSTPEPPATTPPPGPVRDGTIETCKKWHLVVSGDGCWDIQQTYGVPDFATLLLWNPYLGDNCQNLWPDYAICVGV
ncbi:LysM domain-containing protein [Colletotrichum plurivorum]|uniref:LysM domain-containing protein n=1 Tax=Colletotrichum plurivorum TaxID=2175906 RepID=A0A8H6JHW4_9PEZI|nr:LysM domain-containing protein [Colletotrichum plurivorum]